MSGAPSVEFKGADGVFAMLRADESKALALAADAHVQAGFAVEAQVVAAIDASPPTITTTSQIDATAWPVVGA